MTAVIDVRHLGYVDALTLRAAAEIDLAVIHCTELPDLQAARSYGERVLYPGSGTGNCGHFYIERNGRIEEWVPPERIAHHVRGCNDRSIGIELVNRGRFPDWLHSARQAMTEDYPPAQITALLALLESLQQRLPALRWIAGHEALDREEVPASADPALRVRRKRDPGPRFPWPRVLEACSLQPFDPEA